MCRQHCRLTICIDLDVLTNSDFGHLEKLSSNFVDVFEGVVTELSEKMLHTSNLDIHRRANLVLHRGLSSSKSV